MTSPTTAAAPSGTSARSCCASFIQAACRNCGVGRGVVRDCYSTGRGHGYVVQCNQADCREIGPWARTENGARRKWNKRMQDMHNKRITETDCANTRNGLSRPMEAEMHRPEDNQ